MPALSVCKRIACLISLLPCLAIAADRVYYIAADPVVWDDVPSGKNLISGEPFTAHEETLVKAGKHNFSSQFKKALYREYVDASFSKLKPREEKWKHLGFMGPLIRAEVGDTIRITFRNNVSFPASMHPHGVFYQKDSGAHPMPTIPAARTRQTIWCRQVEPMNTYGKCVHVPAPCPERHPLHSGCITRIPRNTVISMPA